MYNVHFRQERKNKPSKEEEKRINTRNEDAEKERKEIEKSMKRSQQFEKSSNYRHNMETHRL